MAMFAGDGLVSPQCGHLLPGAYTADKAAIRKAFNTCIQKSTDGTKGPFGNEYVFKYTSGDGHQVYGEKGELYFGYNINMSLKTSQPDQYDLWIGYNESLGYPNVRATREHVPGTYFSSHERNTFQGSQAEALLWVTDGGNHFRNSGRGDTHMVSRAMEFLSRFRRNQSTFRIEKDETLQIMSGDY